MFWIGMGVGYCIGIGITCIILLRNMGDEDGNNKE